MRIILGKLSLTHSSPLRQQLHWTTLHQQQHKNMLCQVHRCNCNLAPAFLSSKFRRNSSMYMYTLLILVKLITYNNQPNGEFYQSSFQYQVVHRYYQLPHAVDPSQTLTHLDPVWNSRFDKLIQSFFSIYLTSVDATSYILSIVSTYLKAGAYERCEAAWRSVKLQYPSVVESHF